METFSRETLDPWFVTGFVDAAGSFTFSRSSRQIALYFALKLPASDQEILESIQGFFGGLGRIYPVRTTTPGLMLRVTRIAELGSVVAHFDRFPLQTQKRESYVIWREMVEIKKDFRGTTHDALNALATQLSERGR